jgi:phenylacetate-coenzyme A ligase PaaK-like adenylate-forming protein
MKIIGGRVNDYISLPNGKKISSYLCMMTMDKINGVSKYQIVQEKQDKIIINVIYDGARSNNDIAVDIIETYKHILGRDMDIELIPVGEIAGERTGKQRVVISKLS